MKSKLLVSLHLHISGLAVYSIKKMNEWVDEKMLKISKNKWKMQIYKYICIQIYKWNRNLPSSHKMVKRRMLQFYLLN